MDAAAAVTAQRRRRAMKAAGRAEATSPLRARRRGRDAMARPTVRGAAGRRGGAALRPPLARAAKRCGCGLACLPEARAPQSTGRPPPRQNPPATARTARAATARSRCLLDGAAPPARVRRSNRPARSAPACRRAPSTPTPILTTASPVTSDVRGVQTWLPKCRRRVAAARKLRKQLRRRQAEGVDHKG